MDKFYSSKEWRYLRIAIRERDGYRCQICNISVRESGSSQVDHIIPRKQAPHLAYEPGNLRTLCRSCHNKFDRARGRQARIHEPVDASGLPDSWK